MEKLIESYFNSKKCSEYLATTPNDPDMIEWLRLQVVQGREVTIAGDGSPAGKGENDDQF